jgi:hypothetical protein
MKSFIALNQAGKIKKRLCAWLAQRRSSRGSTLFERVIRSTLTDNGLQPLLHTYPLSGCSAEGSEVHFRKEILKLLTAGGSSLLEGHSILTSPHPRFPVCY